MNKAYKGLASLFVAAGLIVGSSNMVMPEASNVIYTEEDVSISLAIDKYIASGSDALVAEPNIEIGIAGNLALSITPKEVEMEIVEDETEDIEPFDFTGKAIVTAGQVNIREKGSIDAKRVGSVTSYAIINVVEKGSEWSLITSGDVKGYIKNEFLAFGEDARTYADANLEKSVVENGDTQVYSYKMYYAYTVADAEKKETTTEQASTETTQSQTQASNTVSNDVVTNAPYSETGAEVAAYAQQFVGNPYVYGGTSLTNGADCSGFVMSVYAAFGVSLPRTADSQATVGTQVSLSELQPGDLVFYDHGTGSITHVALYIGNGQIVHASTSRTGIIIASLNYSTACKAVRIF